VEKESKKKETEMDMANPNHRISGTMDKKSMEELDNTPSIMVLVR